MIGAGFRLSLSASISGQRGSFASMEHDFTLFPHRNHSVKGESRIPSEQTLKSYVDIPGNWRRNWLNVYFYWRKNGFMNFHNLITDNFKTYGPIYREKIGNNDSVYIINPEDIATLFRAEGPFPERLEVKPWIIYRDLRKEPNGLQLKKGEDWKRSRVILNNLFFSQNSVQEFLPLINEVALDFVSLVHNEIEKSGSGYWKVNLIGDLFKFTLESICYLLYGERLGLLERKYDEASQKYIDSIALMFKTTATLLYVPPGLVNIINSKLWQQHIDSWDVIFKHTTTLMQKEYRKFQQGLKNLGIVSKLFQQETFSLEDNRADIIDLMAGAIDTTSTVLQWSMYELGKNPHIQKKLRSEIMDAYQKAEGDPVKMLKLVPFLKCVLKETLRLHPVAITIQRYINEDIVLHNYHVPAGTLVHVGVYAMGKDSKYFRNPEQFVPERWLEREETHFKHLGFGYGPRQCIGRRIAENEFFLFMIQLLRNFEIEIDQMSKVQSVFNLIVIPDLLSSSSVVYVLFEFIATAVVLLFLIKLGYLIILMKGLHP
uniref:Cholesterol side-chain cleavage enzyme, mitochondrial n=1 Tax=Potamotrygon motoro TaxID=86373 RepID=Q38HS0_POTMO|nr:cholesterol side chain cleavage protein [Potamotrygon motoro]